LNTILEASAPSCGSGPPCIDPAFGPTQTDRYWSSSSLAGGPNYAWYVDFFNGYVTFYYFKTLGDYARAVRSGR
jgi:hypothetical protein